MNVKSLVVGVVLVVAMACGGTPTAPTPPAKSPAPAPSRTLSFMPVAATLTQNSFYLADGGGGTQVSVQLRANDFRRLCTKYRATLNYDATLLTVVDYIQGDWMTQGGAVPTWSVTELSNQVAVRIDRPDTINGALGSGVVITLRFKAAGTRTGTTPLQWNDPGCLTPSFNDILGLTYGGSVTVQ